MLLPREIFAIKLHLRFAFNEWFNLSLTNNPIFPEIASQTGSTASYSMRSRSGFHLRPQTSRSKEFTCRVTPRCMTFSEESCVDEFTFKHNLLFKNCSRIHYKCSKSHFIVSWPSTIEALRINWDFYWLLYKLGVLTWMWSEMRKIHAGVKQIRTFVWIMLKVMPKKHHIKNKVNKAKDEIIDSVGENASHRVRRVMTV